MNKHYFLFLIFPILLSSCVTKKVNATKEKAIQIEEQVDSSEMNEAEANHDIAKYDDSGNGVFGRRVIYRNIAPILKDAKGKSGKIQFKVCVNPHGSVIFAELNEQGTTITDNETLKNALKTIYDYKFEPKSGAVSEECGKIIIQIDNFNGLGR